MNPQFCYLWLRHLNSKHQRGFAMPMALMLGLIMIVVGVTLLVQSTGDQTKAISQKTKSASLAAAEAGVTRIQNLLTQAKFASLYDDTEWNSAVDSTGTPVSGSSLEAKLNEFINDTAETACTTSAEETSRKNAIKAALATLKTYAGLSSESLDSKSQFRLVKYEYAGNSGEVPNGPALGRLTVEGKALAENGEEIAATRLTVDIEVEGEPGESVPNPGGAVPGLWLGEQGLANGTEPTGLTASSGGNPLGNQSYDANVGFNNCTENIDNGYLAYLNNPANGVLGNGKTASFVGSDMTPPIESKSGKTLNTLTGITSPLTLPRTSGPTIDTPTGGTYYYQVNGDINLNGNNTLTITPGEKVVIYLNGDITRGTNIEHDCSGVSGCKSSDFIIYGDKTGGGDICLNGNDKINAFIVAPDYRAGVVGNGKIIGSVWVKSWGKITNCSASGNHVVVEQTQTWNDLPPGLIPVSNPKVKLNGLNAWSPIATNATPNPVPSHTGGILTASTPSGSSSSSSSSSVASSSSSSSSSSSVATCTVPNIVGMQTNNSTNRAAVIATINNAGLVVGGTSLSNANPRNVKSVSPPAGTSVQCGSSVSYVYND